MQGEMCSTCEYLNETVTYEYKDTGNVFSVSLNAYDYKDAGHVFSVTLNSRNVRHPYIQMLQFCEDTQDTFPDAYPQLTFFKRSYCCQNQTAAHVAGW